MLVLLHVLATFVMRFVPAGLAHRVVGWATPLALRFVPGYVERAAANLRQILGPRASADEVRRTTVAAFANYARYMVDLVRLPSIDPVELTSRIHMQDWENVEEAYRHNRGVVFVTGHIGSWDLAGAAFAARGKTVSALVETLRPARWNERVQRIREHVGVKAIPVESGVREMLAALRRKEALAILIDRPLDGDGVPVTFFGRTTWVPGGAAILALRTGAPVVPAALLRDASGGYTARIGEPILTAGRGGSPQDVQALTQHIMTWLEGVIHEHPDQWYMFRHMWPGPESAQAGLLPAEAVAP